MIPSADKYDRIRKYAHSCDRLYDWFLYADAYLIAAKVLARDYADPAARSEAGLAPVIFTLRHGLELVLKKVALSAGLTEDLHHHDVQRLFEKVRNIFADWDEKRLQVIAEERGIDRNLISANWATEITNLERLANKYYCYGFLFENQMPVVDTKNELFRYPSSTAQKDAFKMPVPLPEIAQSDLLTDVEQMHIFLFTFVLTFPNGEGLPK